MLNHHLKNLWQNAVQPDQTGTKSNESWNKGMQALYALGIGMEATLRFLYSQKPSLEKFEEWIENNKTTDGIHIPHENESEKVLSDKELEFWNANGYLVLKNVVSAEDCRLTREAIWEYLGKDPENPETWYTPHKDQQGLMLLFSKHPQLNKNRQSPKIRKAYEQLYNSTKIYKSIDKVSFNPPERPGYLFAGDKLHWDVSLKLPIPYKLQGLLYLSDCGAHEGAFNCVPGFHLEIENWIKSRPPGTHPRSIGSEQLKAIAVPGMAGDFVIWHQALPHCATPNHGRHPRMVQYLTYLPENLKEADEWI